MLNKIIEFSIKKKLIIILVTLGLIIYGGYNVTKLPIDAVPDITDNPVQTITVSPSLGAPDVERFITFPLELANNNIAGIKQIRSFSRFGLSVITIVFKEEVDLHLARQQVSERLQQVSGQLKMDYQIAVQNSYAVVDPLNVNAEFGQMNSAYVDNKISASQVLRLPKFYSSQKTVLQEELKSAALSLDYQKWQLKKEISLIYNNLNYFDQKEKLLKKAQEIYQNYFKRADLRLRAGESNILEKTTAENYRSKAEMQLNSLRKDREIALYQFNTFINDGNLYRNEAADFYALKLDETVSDYQGNPLLLRQFDQQKNIETAKLEAEKAKLLPSFNVAISSMTMKGNGGDDKY